MFACRIAARQEHLARLQLADLVLDPWPYNSHSSGIDVLWADVPMLTLRGDSFAGRVGASLLHAVNLRECIAGSPAKYQSLCIDLGRQSDPLGQLRQRLIEGRASALLFDMGQFVRSKKSIRPSATVVQARGKSEHSLRDQGLFGALLPVRLTGTVRGFSSALTGDEPRLPT
jgi:hypothetical protein